MTGTSAGGERLDAPDRQTTPTRHGPGGGRLLGIYLNDHLAGATCGLRLAHRVANAHGDLPIGATLRVLRDEIDSDRAALIAMMRRLGDAERPRARPRRVTAVVLQWAAPWRAEEGQDWRSTSPIRGSCGIRIRRSPGCGNTPR
jgi:hypothetical protein